MPGLEYFINPDFLKRANLKGKNIEDHRLEQLIYKDLSIYSNSSINDLHQRIGLEISKRKIKSTLDKMATGGSILKSGINRWTIYSLNK